MEDNYLSEDSGYNSDSNLQVGDINFSDINFSDTDSYLPSDNSFTLESFLDSPTQEETPSPTPDTDLSSSYNTPPDDLLDPNLNSTTQNLSPPTLENIFEKDPITFEEVSEFLQENSQYPFEAPPHSPPLIDLYPTNNSNPFFSYLTDLPIPEPQSNPPSVTPITNTPSPNQAQPSEFQDIPLTPPSACPAQSASAPNQVDISPKSVPNTDSTPPPILSWQEQNSTNTPSSCPPELELNLSVEGPFPSEDHLLEQAHTLAQDLSEIDFPHTTVNSEDLDRLLGTSQLQTTPPKPKPRKSILKPKHAHTKPKSKPVDIRYLSVTPTPDLLNRLSARRRRLRRTPNRLITQAY